MAETREILEKIPRERRKGMVWNRVRDRLETDHGGIVDVRDLVASPRIVDNIVRRSDHARSSRNCPMTELLGSVQAFEAAAPPERRQELERLSAELGPIASSGIRRRVSSPRASFIDRRTFHDGLISFSTTLSV